MSALDKLRRYVTLEIRDDEDPESDFDLRVRLASANEATSLQRALDDIGDGAEATDLMISLITPHVSAFDGSPLSTEEERSEVAGALPVALLSEVFRAVVGSSDTLTVTRRGKSTSGPS